MRPALTGTALLLRWMTFNGVGLIGIGVQLGVLWTLTSGLRLPYLVATALAVEAAVLHNFVWHQRFTWADRSAGSAVQVLARLLRFNLTTGLFSLAANLLLMRAFVGVLELHPLAANLLAIATCGVVNFLVSHRFVFRPLPE